MSEGYERMKARRAARDASGIAYVDGSIYENMAACVVRSGVTLAHAPSYDVAEEIAAALNAVATPEICPQCSGSGVGVADTVCTLCNGTGGVPVTPSQRLDAATVERCAREAEGWGGAYAHGPVHSTRTYIAAAIRALATEPHQHGAGNGEKHGG